MAKNEAGQVVPDAVAAEAQDRQCVRGVKYVYRDGEYGGKKPVASIGCASPRRFGTDNYTHYKVDLGGGWVAFESPTAAVSKVAVLPLPPGEIPPLPPSRIGKETRTKKIDGSPLVFKVEDELFFPAPSNPKKAFRLQKLRFDDGQGYDTGHVEYRISYYMIAHKPRVKGKWAFGQFAPMMTEGELKLIIERMQEKGWVSVSAPTPGA